MALLTRPLIFISLAEGTSKKTGNPFKMVKCSTLDGKEETFFLSQNEDTSLFKNLQAGSRITLTLDVAK